MKESDALKPVETSRIQIQGGAEHHHCAAPVTWATLRGVCDGLEQFMEAIGMEIKGWSCCFTINWMYEGKLCIIRYEGTTLMKFDLVARAIFDNLYHHLIGLPCSALNWEQIQKLEILWFEGTHNDTVVFDSTFMGANVGLESGRSSLWISMLLLSSSIRLSRCLLCCLCFVVMLSPSTCLHNK